MVVLPAPHRFTVEEYHRMAGAGVFREDDRMELLEGEIVEMAQTSLPPVRPASLAEDWEDLAALDPLWAILSYRNRKFARWHLEDFLATGRSEVDRLMTRADRLGYPKRRELVLDFGCGVGRLAPGLSANFNRYLGIDISEAMVVQARRLHAGRTNCTFVVSSGDPLAVTPARFDLVVSHHVLQHIPSQRTIRTCLEQLLELAAPGGLLVIQLPGHIPRFEKAFDDARRGLYRRLRASGIPRTLLYRRLGLFPMTMNFLPEDQVLGIARTKGTEVMEVERSRVGLGIADRTYYLEKH
jgi:SAM-dependent methyltransferase